MKHRLVYRPLAALMLVASTGGAALAHQDNSKPKPIVLEETGGFVIGGKVITSPTNPNRTLSCDHGYVEYFIPDKARETSLVMWHSSSAQVWQNRYDGGEGYKDMWLRRDYPVYLWDGPHVGRANWGCTPHTYTPTYVDQQNFASWLFGPVAPAGQIPTASEWYPGVQFPTTNTQAWLDTTRSRYLEFDTGANIGLQTDTAAVAADSGRLGDQIVYLTNSAGGLRAMITTSKTKEKNVAGIVTYESIGYPFPIGHPESPANLCDMTGNACAFGPVGIPLEDFKKLAKLKKIQFVWGDNRPESNLWVGHSRLCAKLINSYGGNAEVVKLGDMPGFKGSTHIPFMDMHNDKIAGLLEKFLKSAKLDGYEKKPRSHHHAHHHHYHKKK